MSRREPRLWYWWKRATASYMSTPIGLVSQAMDRKSRDQTPWRYHVWFFAWVVALAAYAPIAVLAALLVRALGRQRDFLPQLALYGPIVLISVTAFYYLIRHLTCRANVPSDWSIEERDNDSQERPEVVDGDAHLVGRHGVRSRSPRPLLRNPWYWIGAALILISIVGRAITEHN